MKEREKRINRDPSAIDFDALKEYNPYWTEAGSCARGRRHDPEKEVVRLHGQSSETRCP